MTMQSPAHVRAVLLLQLLGIAACPKPNPPAVTAPPRPPTAAAFDPAPKLVSGPAISVFTRDAAHCRWSAVTLPAVTRKPLATFDAPCGEAEMVLRGDRGAALVSLGAGHLFEVALPSGTVTPLKAPAPGTLVTVGFTDGGVELALTLQSGGDAKQMIYLGKTYRAPKAAEGLLALAHGFTLGPAGQWQSQEVAATTEGADYSPGVAALKLSAFVADRLSPTAGMPTHADVTPARLAQLNALQPSDDDDTWVALETQPPSYLFEGSGEFVFATTTLAFARGAAVALAPDPPKSDDDTHQAWVEVRAPYLLVATAGDRASPRVYDVRSGAVVFKDDQAVGASFWPEVPPAAGAVDR